MRKLEAKNPIGLKYSLTAKELRRAEERDEFLFQFTEEEIAKDARCSYLYAFKVIEEPFELGEPVIAKDPWYSFYYAHDVLHGRFKLGEPLLRQSEYWKEYLSELMAFAVSQEDREWARYEYDMNRLTVDK